MNLDELKNIDPQRVVTVLFGLLDEETGMVQWDAHWTDVRLLVAHEYGEGWTLTPLSLDGRPANFFLEGHDEDTNGIFASPNLPHVMQVRDLAEPQLLAEAAEMCLRQEAGSIMEVLEDQVWSFEDLSIWGKVFVTSVEGLLELDPKGSINLIQDLIGLMRGAK